MFPNSPLPLLAVFYLDHVLWPYLTNSTAAEIVPPFEKTSAGDIIDSNGTVLHYYEEVPKVFEELLKKNMSIAVVNHAEDTNVGTQLIDAFEWRKKYVQIVQISSVTILTHCMLICMEHDYEYRNLMLFDVSPVNVEAAANYLGVFSYRVAGDNGITLKHLNEAFLLFQREQRFKYSTS